jgi:hypothetical protein
MLPLFTSNLESFLILGVGTWIVHEIIWLVCNVQYLIIEKYRLFQNYKIQVLNFRSSINWPYYLKQMIFKNYLYHSFLISLEFRTTLIQCTKNFGRLGKIIFVFCCPSHSLLVIHFSDCVTFIMEHFLHCKKTAHSTHKFSIKFGIVFYNLSSITIVFMKK